MHVGHPHYLTDSQLLSLKKNADLSHEEKKSLRMMKYLSDPTKLNIYALLHKVEELPVTDISLVLGVSQSAVSHALSDLKDVGLVEAHRCGQLICYALANDTTGDRMVAFFRRLTRS